MAFSTPNFYIKVCNMIHVNNLTIYEVVHKEIKKNGCDCSLNHIDVSGVSSFIGLFSGCSFSNGKFPDISAWDTRSLKYMKSTFYHSSVNCDLSMWDTSNVVDMSYAFAFADVRNVKIANWDTSKLCNVEYMFNESNFDEDISGWDLSSVRSKRHMFGNNMSNKAIYPLK